MVVISASSTCMDAGRFFNGTDNIAHCAVVSYMNHRG
jgi:hypothetical protein